MDYDTKKLARYPFLTQAKEYVESLGLTLDKMLEHPVYSACVEAGRKRLLDAMNGTYRPDTSDPLSTQLTVLSYPIARILANSLNNRHLLEKYAAGEADAAYRMLAAEDRNVTEEVIADVGLKYENNLMPLAEYLKLSKYLAKKHGRWKLVNRVLDEGNVKVDDAESKELLREAVKLKVMETVNVTKIPDRLKNLAKNLKASLTGSIEEVRIENVDHDALPDCIKKMVAMLEDGTASHNAMFILATFFLNLGLGKEAVLSIFSRSPGYKEDVSRYQIEFLSGEKSGKQYTCPTCETIRSYGLGCSDCDFKHPLQKYRANAKRRTKPPKNHLKKEP